MLTVRQLEYKDVAVIYTEHLCKDFPPEEQKPLEIMKNRMQEGLYPCYGLYDNSNFVAYAFFASTKERDMILIDYLAVCEGYRNHGYGSSFISLLMEELNGVNGIIFEVESGKSAKTQEELHICNRRLAFYQRNGLVDTTLSVDMFDVDLKILYLSKSKKPEDTLIEEKLNAIYDLIFGKKLHASHVKLYKRFDEFS